MKKHLSYMLYFLIIFTISCDFDRYVGYDLDAQELLETTRVSGTVRNFYTLLPVPNARIRVGLLETISDINGRYNINYILTDDENRNKPVELNVQAHNFFSFTDTTLLKPISNQFNFRIKYAAPIVQQAARVYDNSNPFIVTCQSIVFDYQGWENISSVHIVFFYAIGSDSLILQMERVYEQDANTAYYQVIREDEVSFTDDYFIIVEDFDGFSDKFELSNNPFKLDDFLFNPNI